MKVNKGQTVALTCAIDVNGVVKKDITWSKDGTQISTGISEDRCVQSQTFYNDFLNKVMPHGKVMCKYES